MKEKDRIKKLSEIQATSEHLEKICEMLDPEFLKKVRENSLNDNGVSSIDYIHENLKKADWSKKKKTS